MCSVNPLGKSWPQNLYCFNPKVWKTVESPQWLSEKFALGNSFRSSDFLMILGNSLGQIFPDNHCGLSTVYTTAPWVIFQIWTTWVDKHWTEIQLKQWQPVIHTNNCVWSFNELCRAVHLYWQSSIRSWCFFQLMIGFFGHSWWCGGTWPEQMSISQSLRQLSTSRWHTGLTFTLGWGPKFNTSVI